MKHTLLLGIAVLLATSVSAQEFKLGSKVTEFTLQTVQGQNVNFSQIKGDLTVLMFIATQCPVSNAYNDRMNALYRDYASRGVKFIAINSNATEPAPDVASHAAKHGFQFTVYKDHNNVVADRFGAQVTPEIFVVDRNGVIAYHGSIDDSQNPANIKTQGLRLALDALLAGKPVEKASTKAFGCTIKRAKTAS
ncbi:MAG: redoxin domain-containing protein [Bryobacteraceae bacterium]